MTIAEPAPQREMHWPSVFVIVLGWNGKADTVDCLASLTQLQYPNYAVTFVDNGSADDSVSSVRRQYPGVTVTENGRNLGYAEGNNVGMRAALAHGADYIFLLNNDTVITPLALSQLIEFAEQDRNVGIVCPAIVSFLERRRVYVGAKIYWPVGTPADVQHTGGDLPPPLDTDYAPGCAVLIKAGVARKIGLLDPSYFAYFEDVDWSLRCRHAGYRVMVVPQATILHKGTADQIGRKSPIATYLWWRNHILFVRRYGRWHHWPGFLKYYARQFVTRFSRAQQNGEFAHAEAMVNGFWAGVRGKWGDKFVTAPLWFNGLFRRHLWVLLRLTAWLYFWDYRKAKRDAHLQT